MSLKVDIDCGILEQGGWDIQDVALLLKLFFKELPDPLFPRALYHQFMDAGRKFSKLLMISRNGRP